MARRSSGTTLTISLTRKAASSIYTAFTRAIVPTAWRGGRHVIILPAAAAKALSKALAPHPPKIAPKKPRRKTPKK